MDELTGKQRMALRNLLGAIVLADGLIRDTEVRAFANKVCSVTGGRFDVRQESIWLLNSVGEIRERMTSPGARYWLEEQIAVLRSAPQLTDLLDAIWSVAVSDSDLHPNEASILDRAFASWMQ